MLFGLGLGAALELLITNQPRTELPDTIQTSYNTIIKSATLDGFGCVYTAVARTKANPKMPTIAICLIINQFKAGYELQNTIHWIKSISIDPEDIGRNNGLRDINNNEYISIGHFKPFNSDRYLSDLQEYIFHFTKNGNVKIDKFADGVGVTYQDKSNIKRWERNTKRDRRDRGNVWPIPYPTIQKHRAHLAVFPVKLPQRCIELHGIEPNMLVYDPFMGIGNTALELK